MIDWKSSFIVLLLAFTSFVYLLNNDRQNFKFEIDSSSLKYHSNWTSSFNKLSFRKELESALKIKTLQNLDLSFAHSNFKADFVAQLFPAPFSSSFENVKLNMGSLPLETKDVEYLLSLVPNGVRNLEIHLDSINLSSGFGVSLAYQLNRFTLLESLTISLVLSLPKHQEEMGIFFKLHKPRQHLKDLNLILIGNNFKADHFQRFPTYLAKFNLTGLQLNLYANKLESDGAELISKAIKTQPNLRELTIDLYFNNIGENGTNYICEQISELQNLQSLALNFDFNYIKNEGGKYIGSMLEKVKNLKELEIGVASKNFGYLGFKSVIDGMKTQTNLQKLILRCGVNRVGMNGAHIVKDMLNNMPKLQYLNLGFVENYIGDEGLTILSQSISKISTIKHLMLNLGFNDAKSYGLINTLKAFSQNAYEYLFISLSHNEFRDSDVQLISKLLPVLIQQNKHFDFDFVDTAVSKKLAQQIKHTFAKANAQFNKISELAINSIIQESEPSSEKLEASSQKKQNQRKTDLDMKKQKEEKQRLELEEEQKKRQKQEKLQNQRKEQERIANEKKEQERIANEKKEQEKIANQKKEQARIANEKKEQERIANEKKEQQRIANQKKKQEKIANQKKQQEIIANEKKEQQRIVNEKKQQEKLAHQKKQQERTSNEKQEQQIIANQKKEQQIIVNEKNEQEIISNESLNTTQQNLQDSPYIDAQPVLVVEPIFLQA